MRRRTRQLVTLALLCALFAVSCGTGSLPRVRVINASPDAPEVDVGVTADRFSDGFTIARNVAFREVSNYERVNDGFQDVFVVDSRSNQLLLEGVPFLAERQDFTIVLIGSVQFLDAILLADDNSPPTANSFKLRFVHASPTSDPVDVYLTAPNADITAATPTFANVAFGASAGYASEPAASLQLRVTATGTKTVLADSGMVAFGAGQVRTAVLVNPPGTATQPLGIVIAADFQ